MTSVPDLKGDIAAFDHAISVVSGEIQGYESSMATLKATFGRLPDSWRSPAAGSAGQLQDALSNRTQVLHDRLSEVLTKLQKTRAAYQTVLDTNSSMLGGGS